MPGVVVCNPKGGAGKTTVSTNLAVALSHQGERVILHDLDPQKSSSDWLKMRLKSSDSIQLSDSFEANSDDWHVFDTAAGLSVETLQKLEVSCDHLLIPVLASPIDIKVVVRFIMKMSQANLLDDGWKVAMIANRVRRATISQRVLDAFLHHLQIPFIAKIGDSQNYIRAAERGLGLFDLPKNRVVSEVIQWNKILVWLRESA